MSSKVIIKVQDQSIQEGLVEKIIGNTDLKSIISLIDSTGLSANPRKAKRNAVTAAIIETLHETPELFHYMSKGILLASSNVRGLERKRLELKIDDPTKEGILDGGHNTFAIGCYVLNWAGYQAYDKIKGWDHLKEIWDEYADEIDAITSDLPRDIRIPIEIIYPSKEASGLDDFNDSVLAISAARNNNAQLKETAKANKAGFYDVIKDSLDPELVGEIEWQENDGGRIKTADIVALSLIPLSILPSEEYTYAKVVRDNPSMISSSKGACIKLYNEFMSSPGVTQKDSDGVKVRVCDPLVESALEMMQDIPRLYDYIYKAFPDAYNSVSKGFGRIKSVKILDAEKWKDDKKSYMRKPALTKFYQEEVAYQLPDGFIYPLLVAMNEHMEIKNNRVQWKSDPQEFLKKNIGFVFENGLQSLIKGQNYEPGNVTKDNNTYKFVSNMYKLAYQLNQ
ncbi:hypothetical protein CGJ26_11105 [Vibrio parahaemolyticus]|uniref:AIPR family protein n=1 Tax=Vibrio parahaemolyticus TaxID=670 RepID=UPI00111D3B8F|nr:AIPR family protein [Vibrio parahaemolyticus]TOF21206.1 hypothetical protein CGJ26_11105 [Vibrio parahaemolyticus]